ncbi:one cut domain family member 2 [Sarotherodon galilaeus]
MQRAAANADSAMEASAAAGPPPPVAATFAVALKLPDFWLHDPPSWFVHVEAQFALRGISADDTKYHHVVASLDPLATRRAMTLLRDPPAQGKYTALKELLLRRYALSDAERAEKLLNLSGLGGGTRARAHGEHAIDYRSLAEEADRILLASRTFNVHALATDSPAAPSTPPPASPGASAPLLTAGVATRRHRGKNICFYHQRFGDRARRCLPPCAFTAQGNGPASAP